MLPTSIHIANPNDLAQSYFTASLRLPVNSKALHTAADTIEMCKPSTLPHDGAPSISESVANLRAIAAKYEADRSDEHAAAEAREAAQAVANDFARKANQTQITGANLRGQFEASDHRSAKASNAVTAQVQYYSTAALLTEHAFSNGSPNMAQVVMNHGKAAGWVKEHYLLNSHPNVKRAAANSVPEEVKKSYGKLFEENAYQGYA